MVREVGGELLFDQLGQGRRAVLALDDRLLVGQFLLDDPRRDQILAIEGADPADQIFKLAHIARPGMPLQAIQSGSVNSLGWQALAIGTQQECACQVGNILRTIAQGWNSQGCHIQPEEQIFAEQALLNQRPQIAVGSGNNADVRPTSSPGVQGRFRAVNDPQQPRLRVQRHVTDLVQKQRTAIGVDQLSMVGLVLAEQFGFDPLARCGGQVDDHELAVAAASHVVECARNQLLARPGLTGDQYGQVRTHQPGDGAIHLLHWRRSTDERQSIITHGASLGLRSLCVGRSGERAPGRRGHVIQIERLGDVLKRPHLSRVNRRDQAVLGAHHDDRQFRALFLDPGQDVEHVFIRHHDVGDDEVTLPVSDPFQQGGGVACCPDLIPKTREGLAEHQPDRGVIVGDQDLLGGGVHAEASWGVEMGRSTRNTVRPGSDSKSIKPPCPATSFATSARPRPAPLFLEVTKG